MEKKVKIIRTDILKDYLGFGDVRSVRDWCIRNDVIIIKQGKVEFVIEAEFKEVYERPFINKLKWKFGDDWKQVYLLYADGNIPALNILNDLTTAPIVHYQSQTGASNQFLQKLIDYETKKKNAA